MVEHKIKEMDANLKLLMKQVAECNAKDKTISRNAEEMRAIAKGKKKQKKRSRESKW